MRREEKFTQGEVFLITIKDTKNLYSPKKINYFFNKEVKEGTLVPLWLYIKLLWDDRERLKKLRQEKQKKNGGLGSQYQANQQKAFPPGTILVPQYQANKVEVENISWGTN